MPEAVVDALEVVEVREHERQRRAEPERAGKLAGERLLRGAPVREPGECVDQGLSLENSVQAGVLEGGDAVTHEQRRRLDVLDRELLAAEDQRPEAHPTDLQR